MQETRKRIKTIASLLVIAGVVLLCLPNRVADAINSQVHFQGKLANPDGTNVTNGTYSVLFTIYDGGTETAGGTNVWSETQSVTVADGIFNVQLGSVNTTLATAVDFTHSPLYLSVKVGSDAEMTPRILFTAAPYAFNSANADALGGIASSGYVQLSPGAQQTGNINVSGGITGGSSLAFSAASAASIQSAASQALNITGNAASTFSTSAGQLTLQSGNGTIGFGSTTAVTSTGNMTFSSGGSMSIVSATTNAVSLDSGTTGAVNIGTGANGKAITIGNTTTGTTITQMVGDGSTTAFVLMDSTALLTVDSTNNKIVFGSSTTDTTQVLVQLDSFDTFADTASCGATTNQGGLYYNTQTNVVRGCVNGAWEDMVSTAGLGMQLFGVLPDSGTNPGDIYGVTGATNGPCKVSVGATTTTVSWRGCTAYSGGRKVIVAAGTATTTNTVAGRFQHLCLTGTDSQPALSASGTEVANLATVSFPSVTAPILCLADIRFAAANNTITQIYDTRTYTTTEKTPITLNSATGVGSIVVFVGTRGVVQTSATANSPGIAGVIVATTGAASTNTVNAILATSGPAAVKAISGTLNNYIFISGTAGYAQSNATKPAEGTGTIYNVLGNVRTPWSGGTACAINADACAGSISTIIDKR